VIPSVTPIRDQCEENLSTWKRLAEERKEEKETTGEKDEKEE